MLEAIIRCMIQGSSDDGVSPERIRAWIAHKLDEAHADAFWAIHTAPEETLS